MARIHNTRLQLLVLSCTLFGACDSGGDAAPSSGEGLGGGKADDASRAPVGTLVPEGTDQGFAAADAVKIYVVEAAAGSVIDVQVERSSGDLDPTAFLFDGIEAAQRNDFERPSHGFSNTSSVLRAAWQVPHSGELLLVVGAADGSAGEFELSMGCHPESPVSCVVEHSDGVDGPYCQVVEEAFLRCEEADIEDDGDPCEEWDNAEATTDDEDCCALWAEEGEPLADFC